MHDAIPVAPTVQEADMVQRAKPVGSVENTQRDIAVERLQLSRDTPNAAMPFMLLR
jgi:hypothetical protein